MVQLEVRITLHKKDKALLEEIQNYFGVGRIDKHGTQSYEYRASSVKDLAVIINHFNNYPLITQKFKDYQLFYQAFNLINKKEHLTIEGLTKIVAIKANQNRGLSNNLKAAFPDVIPQAPEISFHQGLKIDPF